MTDREIMQQALEALEEINKLSIGENAICLPAEIDTAMDALRERLARPNEFEPDWDQVEALQESLREHMAEIHRLRQWQGLTDGERNSLWRDVTGWGDPSHDDEDLMKAIEAKLKEKNHG